MFTIIGNYKYLLHDLVIQLNNNQHEIGIALLGLGLLTITWWGMRSRHRPKTRWRIRSASRAIKKLNSIENPAHQFRYLRKIHHFTFEEMVLTAYANKGHIIQRNSRYTGDGGIDGQVWMDGQHYLVQAKRYANHIDKKDIIALDHLCRKMAAKGLFVHTGKTGGGVASARTPAVNVISGQKLLELFRLQEPIEKG